MVCLDDRLEAAKRLFGIESFRPAQEEIIQSVIDERDTLALLPTGSGKSLCYQLPAMLRDRPTLVITPLKSLIKDQIDHLGPEVQDLAANIDSSINPAEVRKRLERVRRGEIKLLYAAPERLRQREFVEALKEADVGLVCVDEAHCIALWGQNFRPDYMYIRPILAMLGNPPVLGMTATATPDVAKEIGYALNRKFRIVRLSVVRKNLEYNVMHCGNRSDKLGIIATLARRLEGPGIVYTRSRADAERVAGMLLDQGHTADFYHAERTDEDRAAVQNVYLSGKLRVITATTAFGMGVDKPDIRWIIMMNYPTSIEEFVQQAGRAGRDGRPSSVFLLASSWDATLLRKFARGNVPEVGMLRKTYAALQHHADGDGQVVIEPRALDALLGLPQNVESPVLVGIMERCGLLERRFNTGRRMQIQMMPPPRDASQRMGALLMRVEQAIIHRAEYVIRFASAQSCRHRLIAEHFGEPLNRPCMRCDICNPYSDRSSVADRSKPNRRTESRSLSGISAELFGKLRDWRKGVAAKRNVPAFVVFNDRTLRDLAISRPENPKEMRSIWGMGSHKVEDYGAEILDVLWGDREGG